MAEDDIDCDSVWKIIYDTEIGIAADPLSAMAEDSVNDMLFLLGATSVDGEASAAQFRETRLPDIKTSIETIDELLRQVQVDDKETIDFYM